ncbi:MAG: DEAD/DEAH box helicase [Bacilli bacterium]
MKFEDFKLKEPIYKAILKEGYEVPTPVQEQTINKIIEGNDILGCAQTGTGKTAAFALPLLHLLLDNPSKESIHSIKVLILTPTRELAIQIRDNFRTFGENTNIKTSVIFGGVNQHSQVEVLRKGIDVLVATPGRLLDLINQGHVRLENTKYLVLDEADTMLDMGFLQDVKKIVARVPKGHQTMLFSATMPKEIEKLSQEFLNNPTIVKVSIVSSAVDTITQNLYYIDKVNKVKLLIQLLNKEEVVSALVFTRTKHGANKLGELLDKAGINSGIIHGNKSQPARVSALKDFKEGKTKVLIATDIAARGIDINALSHVINYDMPEKAETYVHRIGRTGRAGVTGVSISFCDYDEKPTIKEIEKLIKQQINVIDDHDYPMTQLFKTEKKQGGRSSKPRSFGAPYEKKKSFNHQNKKSSYGNNSNSNGSYNKRTRGKTNFQK